VYKSVLFLLFLAASWRAAQGAATATAPVADSRVLLLDNCVMPLPTAKATLIVGPLTRTNGVYVGDFKVKVFPYFFKSDRGSLAINVPDQTLTAIHQGKTVAITGTSTSAKNGKVRHVEIRALPKDNDQGTVCLWFMVGDQKMFFTSTYHFAGNTATTAKVPAPALATSLR